MLTEQCYTILGIKPNASIEQVKKAYRKRAKQFHPDKNKAEDAMEKFQLINEAYHTLLKRIEFPEISEEEIIEDYKKYGTSIRNKTYNGNYHPNIHNNNHNDDDYKPNLTTNDKYMYYIFVLIGINMLVIGIKKLFLVKWEGMDNLTGVITSVLFLFIIIYGWNVMKKSK
jgi:hypothetical protein